MIVSKRKFHQYVVWIGFALIIYFTIWVLMSISNLRAMKKDSDFYSGKVEYRSWNYLKSIVHSSYMSEIRENDILASVITDKVKSIYRTDSTLIKDLNNFRDGKESSFSEISDEILKYYNNKLILYVKGNEVVIVNDKFRKSHIQLDGASIFSNTTLNKILNDYVQNKDKKNNLMYNPYTNQFDTNCIKQKFIKSNMDISSITDVVLCTPTYINFETGIFGKKIIVNGERNPNTIQFIIISNMDFSKIVEKNPQSVIILNNFRNDKDFLKNSYDNLLNFQSLFIIINIVLIVVLILFLIFWYDMIIMYYKFADRQIIEHK